jgi:hypothetical protein
MWSGGRGTGSGAVRFRYAPMRVEDIREITPMGLMVGAHVTPSDHIYLSPQDPEASRFRYDVFAPADGFVVNIQHRVKLDGTSETRREYDDYRVVIEHSATFWSYYDLITRLDETILKRLKAADRERFDRRAGGSPVMTRIPVTAGQVIGQIGGRTLDFGVVNSEQTLSGLLVPEHYLREPWKIHTVDPFDYFDEPLRSRLLQLNPRTAEPRGGRIDHDVDGRLAGNWFLEGTNGYAGAGDPRGYWMGHLAIVYHHVDPKWIIASIGDYEGRPRQFGIKGNGPDPADVGESDGPIKYELVQITRPASPQPFDGAESRVYGVLLAQVLAGRKLKVELFPGQTAVRVLGFTHSARTYER